MDIIQAIALALLQGLTEFLPISSSAHLILLPIVLGWEDQGLAFDVAVHVGTLTAVVAYYRKDLQQIISAWFASICGQGLNDAGRLAWFVILATIPVGLTGISLPDAVLEQLRSPIVIASSTIAFGILLWYAQNSAKESRQQINIFDALVIGTFQALALIPGTSRSGITITAGLLTGLQREQAARFSFLLSIPSIALPGMLKSIDLVESNIPVAWDLIILGTVTSAIIAYLTIGWFLRLLQNIGLMPFVYYRLILGIILFAIFL